MKQDHKVKRERTSALNFASVQISNVKHSKVLRMIYHHKMNIMEQASTNIFDVHLKHFHLMKHFGQSLGLP